MTDLSMEQTLLDFFTKSSDLIFRNRLSAYKQPEEADPKDCYSHLENNFQLAMDNKADFPIDFSPDWCQKPEKLLVLEFFVCFKAKEERFLVEQWIFEISDEAFERVHDTVDSAKTLYKRLSILLRTISLLTVTLPVYQQIVKDNNNVRSKYCTIEFSVSYSKETLSAWPTSINESNDVVDYSSSDFVLPGRLFAFKVKYYKSLKFLQGNLEQVFEKEKAEEITQWRNTNCLRRAFSDNCYKTEVNSLLLMNSPPTMNPLEECMNIQVEEIPFRKRVNSGVSEPRVWDMKKFMDDNNLSMCTMESGNFGEGDIFLYEDDDEKFTEILSWKDAAMKNQSPTRLDFQQQRDRSKSGGVSMLRKMSDEYEKTKRKISLNVNHMEKIIEHTRDDKIAELLESIEMLKALANKEETYGFAKTKGERKVDNRRKGLRFESILEDKKEAITELVIEGLRNLYLQIKGLATTM